MEAAAKTVIDFSSAASAYTISAIIAAAKAARTLLFPSTTVPPIFSPWTFCKQKHGTHPGT